MKKGVVQAAETDDSVSVLRFFGAISGIVGAIAAIVLFYSASKAQGGTDWTLVGIGCLGALQGFILWAVMVAFANLGTNAHAMAHNVALIADRLASDQSQGKTEAEKPAAHI